MQVSLDLRPAHLVFIQEQKVDIVRLLSVLLLLIFLILSVVNIGFTAFKLRDVRAELASTRGEQVRVKENGDRLSASIVEMRKMRDRVKAYLEFTRLDLPTVEFMAALEGAVPNGLKIANLEIRPGNVLMRGAALTDQEIIDFGAKLDSMRNIVTRVGAPVTTKGTLGGRRGTVMISEYSIACNIRSISDVASSYPELTPSAEEGGEGQ